MKQGKTDGSNVDMYEILIRVRAWVVLQCLACFLPRFLRPRIVLLNMPRGVRGVLLSDQGWPYPFVVATVDIKAGAELGYTYASSDGKKDPGALMFLAPPLSR